MKKMKKLLSLIIALTMVMGLMSFTAFAAEGDGDGEGEDGGTPAVAYDQPLTVTGLAAGDTVKFYQILEWVGETEDDSDVSGWKAVAPFDEYLDKDMLTSILVGTPEIGDTPAVSATGITSEIAGKLARLAADGGTPVTVEDDGIATLDNEKAGMWMALITPADANTVYNPVFVSSDYDSENEPNIWGVNDDATYSDFAAAKKSELTLTKTFENEDDYNGDDGQTTAVGDTVTFTVTTAIPGYGEVYTNPHFAIYDSLTDLVLVVDSVEIVEPENLTENVDYTIEPEDAGDGYTITFDKDYLKTVTSATKVVVTYKAIVTSEAALAINEEDNDVYIEYSHDPTNESDYDVKKDTTQHYTFTLDASGAGNYEGWSGKKTSELVKIGVDAAGQPIYSEEVTVSDITEDESWEGPLENAVFGLWKNANCTGEPYLTASTGPDGRMTFKGLDAGTYYLQEISAPAGYVTNTEIHTIVIEALVDKVNVTEYWTGEDWVSAQNEDPEEPYKSVTYETEILKSYTVTVDEVPTALYEFTNESTSNSNEIKWETVDAVEHPFEFVNIKAVELPSTGGMGTTIFYIIGGILVLGAVIVLVSRRRMKA